MPAAILIGFEYRILTIEPTGRSFISLNFPGTFIDLSTVNLFCRDQKWDTTIITDIIEEQFPEGIVNKVTGGSVDAKSLVFYTRYSKDFRLVGDKKSFIDTLSAELKRVSNSNEKKLFIYYTGHGVNNDDGKSSILLPNAQRISFDKLRSIITEEVSKDVEVMIVLDCCYPNNMNLPYTLKENIIENKMKTTNDKLLNTNSMNKQNKKTQKQQWLLNNEYLPSQHNILLITSATRYQTSAATKFGSLFTDYFFDYLRNLNKPLNEKTSIVEWPNRNLITIANKVSHDVKLRRNDEQNISIYCSYKIVPMIPWWIGGLKNKIIIDTKSKLILIENKI